MKKLKKIFIIFLSLFLFGLMSFGVSNVFSQTCSNQAECENLINQYQNQINKLQGQANTLANQIKQFDAQIRLMTIKIQQTEEKIALLGGRIDQLEVSLESLSKAFASRAVETYKMSRTGSPFLYLLSSEDLAQATVRFHYLGVAQEADRSLLQRLQKAQTDYKGQKVDQEELQAELAKEKNNLNSQKSAKANLLSATKNDEKKYQTLLSQAKSQLDRFRKFTISQGGASILSNQTKCDGWGCYFNQRDSEWGNKYLGGTNYLMKDSGCFISSVAMLASHGGKNIRPGDIAQLSAAVTSAGELIWSFSVNGINVSISSASRNDLDQRLGSGPVIAGLYGGPDHFIVILRKEGSEYIMHDPFLENGSNRKLSEKYSVSDINSLRLVQFN